MGNLIKRSAPKKTEWLGDVKDDLRRLIEWIGARLYNMAAPNARNIDENVTTEIQEFGEMGYQALLNKFAVEIGKAFSGSKYESDLPIPLCGSILEVNTEVKLPAQLIVNLHIDQVLDEYFGIIYQPSRVHERFGPDITKVLANRIRREYLDIDAFVEGVAQQSAMGEILLTVVDAVDVFIDLFGLNETKLWWRSLSREELLGLVNIIKEYNYDEFVNRFGGGGLTKEDRRYGG